MTSCKVDSNGPCTGTYNSIIEGRCDIDFATTRRYIRNKNQQNTHFFFKDFIQLYCLRLDLNNQAFILRKTCTCKNCMYKSS